MSNDEELPSETKEPIILDEQAPVTEEQFQYLEERAGVSPEILIPKKNVIIDSQIFTTIMGCGRLTDFRFNHHFVSIKGKSKSLEMGSIVHTFLETFNKAIISGQFRSTAIDLALAAAKQYANSNEVRNTSVTDRDWAIKTCEMYIDFRKTDTWVPLEVEKVKGKVIYEDDEVRILWKSKFDLIADTQHGILPVDYKSMSQRRDTHSLNNQFTGQCVVQGTSKMIIEKIGFQTSLEPKDKFQRILMPFSADRIKEWQQEIVPYWVKIMLAYAESGYWPPNFTHCETKYGFCDFIKTCEADRILRASELRDSFVVGEPWDVTND